MRFRSSLSMVGAIVLALPMCANAQSGGEQSRSTDGIAILGRVTDRATGLPLERAHVVFRRIGTDDRAWEGVSSPRGAFLAPALSVGAYEFTAEMLGFTSISYRLLFDAPGDMDLHVELVPEALSLDPIVVTARRRSRLETSGFYARRDAGSGYFITRENIEQRNPFRVADLFHMIPGARVQVVRASRTARVTLRGGCTPTIILNGHPVSVQMNLDDLVSLSDIEALEVYHGSSAPIHYSQFSTCGTIMVWTREGRLGEGEPLTIRKLLAASGIFAVLILLGRSP